MGNFTEVTSLDADVTIAIGGRNKKTGKNNPTEAEGYFLGTRMVDSPKSKSGKAAIHFLQTPKGNLGIWGKTDMDKKFAQVTPGTMIRVSFDKMVPTPNGEMYKYKLEVDKSNTIDVADLTGASNAGGGFNAGAEEDDELDSESDYEDEEAAQVSALSALERRNKVESLLKGNKGRTGRN